MSILIKGMTMPKNCEKCPFGHDDSCSASIACTLLNGKRLDVLKRPKGICPLVELPPHGRLIDEENLCGKLRPLIENPYCYNRLQIISETLAYCLQIIADAPTIIEAEEGEEQREYEAQVEAAQYCEMYEPTYDPETGAL